MTSSAHNDSGTSSATADRWLLWVDGAGGFLVVTSDSVSIGGPAGEDEADVAVQADLHRREAVLSRRNGEYSVQAVDGRLHVDDLDITSPITLRPSESFLLGGTIRFHFSMPQPLSGSARLTVDPRTRLRPHVDAAILMDDTLLMGPTDDCHVPVPHATGSLVLVCHAGRWQAKPAGAAGVWQSLEPGSRFQSFGISMTLEALR